MAQPFHMMGPGGRNRFNVRRAGELTPEEVEAFGAAMQAHREVAEPEEREGGTRRPRLLPPPPDDMVPVYLSKWLPLFANAGPRAADYARRASLGLDAAARPVVGPGVGGYASPRETDNAKSVFLDNARGDANDYATRLQALLRRLQSYQ
jgi:hypothetical protein